MKFRGWSGELMDREDAESMVRSRGIEVGYDAFVFNGDQVLIKSRLQPIYHDDGGGGGDPLFITTVLGDRELGTLEYGSRSEQECRHLHESLVDRYLLLERERSRTPKVLLDGVL